MWQIRVGLSLVLCLALTLAGRADRRNSGVRVRIQKKDVHYIADEYNSRLEPIDYDYDDSLVERVAVDRRGYVYAVGANRFSVLKVGRNRQLRLVHTEEFGQEVSLQSVQTCNGIVTVAMKEGGNEEGTFLVYRTYNKHMPGGLTLLHSVPVPDGPEHHQLTKDCGRAIIALETASRIGVVTFGASKFDAPSLNVLDWAEFADMRDALEEEEWLLVGGEGTFEDLFDPEWVCINKKDTMAFVNFKNNNGYAKLDLTSPGMETVTRIGGYGVLDWSFAGNTQGADFSDEDGGAILRNLPILSTYNPEQISCITIKNQNYMYIALPGEGTSDDSTFLNTELEELEDDDELVILKNDCIVLAGEGSQDGSFFFDVELEELGSALDESLDQFKSEAIAGDIHVLLDNILDTDGDEDIDKIVTTGSRGYDIRCGDDLAIKASTGSTLELKTMDLILFNVEVEGPDDGEHARLGERFDEASDDRGPEPEGVITKLICGGRQLLLVGTTEHAGHLWAFTLDTWNMEAGFQFQDNMHGYKRTDSFLTEEELYEERLLYLRNAEGLAFIEGKHSMSRRNRGIVSVVVGSKVTSTVETYDFKFQCRPSRGRNRHW